MATDTTVLNDAAIALLATLQAGIDDADWDITARISAGEPAQLCDGVNVWIDQIDPDYGTGGGSCVAASRVRFKYTIGDCIGADLSETLIFAANTQHHGRVWAIWAELVNACCGSTLLGTQADTVRVGALNLTTTQGGMFVWTGTVTGVLSPLAL